MPQQVGDAALLVDPLDPHDIAMKMKSILDSKILANSLVEKGHKRVEEYSQNEFAKLLEGYINSCI